MVKLKSVLMMEILTIIQKRSTYAKTVASKSTYLFLILLSACGSPLTESPFNETDRQGTSGTTGQAGQGQAGSVGSLSSGGSIQSFAGLPGSIGSSGGGASSGGNAGNAGGSHDNCLVNYARLPCGESCTHAPTAYAECRQVLDCMLEKSVKLPIGSLDTCYPAEYTALQIAGKVLETCCNQ